MIFKITGGEVLIDDEDLEIISNIKWYVSDTGYALSRRKGSDGKSITVRMHRLIMSTPKGLVTDHINHNRLDNRKSNLRICTQSDNMRNLSNQGRGYYFHKNNNNWVVNVNNKHIGSFNTEQEASNIVSIIRSGGVYIRPERTECKLGHSLSDAYIIGNRKCCKKCQSRRSKQYYVRKTKR